MNFTSNSLSKELGVTQPTIKKLEKGETLPNAKVLIPLIEKYNVNANWLLTGQGEMFLSKDSQGGVQGDGNIVQVGNKNNTNTSNSNNSSDQKELEHLREKVALLEKTIEDKEELIRLLKK